MAESLEDDEMQVGSTKLQAHGWNQDTSREKKQTGRRGREVQMSTCRLRVLAGRRGALHRGMCFATAAAKDGELRHFDAEQALFEASVDEGICIRDSRGTSGVFGGIGLLNKIYGLVQARRCLFNIFGDNKTTIAFE